MCSAWSNSRARFFSVSPMYFDTTRDRSIRNTGRPVYLPSSVAVSVLPVPGRAVEQRPVARLDPLAHAPLAEHRVVEADPVLDLADLAQRVRVEHDVVPLHLGLDVLGREVDAEPRQADRAGREPLDDLGVEDQPPAHHRLALAHRVEPQHMAPGEPVLARQQALHLEPSGEVVPGEHELRRLAGRQHAAVVLAADAAELRQVAALGQVLADQPPEEVGAEVRARARAGRARAPPATVRVPPFRSANCRRVEAVAVERPRRLCRTGPGTRRAGRR